MTDNKGYTFNQPTLAGQLEAAGLSFAGYADTGSPRKHNPWESFTASQHLGKDFGEFPDDFTNLPTVSFVSPSDLHNMHDGSVREGDSWLQQNMGDYAEWAKTHNSLLIVTFDEGEEDGINHIPTIIYGAGVVPGEYTQAGDHYDLLRTIEDLYGLPALGHAAEAEVMLYGLVDPDGRDGADTIEGGAAADVLDGGAGDDILRGRGGNDSLLGGDGNDRLVGGWGDDELTGGAGSDVFRFNKGQDTITDFQDGSVGDDLLRFDDLLWGGQVLTTNQILAFAHVEGSDILFDFGNGNTLRFQGTTNISALADDLVVV